VGGCEEWCKTSEVSEEKAPENKNCNQRSGNNKVWGKGVF
jgi:hypothetical protein